MKKVIILTEGSQEYGYGHISRCCAFYDMFSEKGFAVEFIVHGDIYAKFKLGNRIFKLLSWHGRVADKLVGYLECDILIVDSYHITQSDADIFSNLNIKLVVIEDFIRRNYVNAIIIDWSLDAEILECYSVKEKSNTYLLGLEYLVVRKAFLELSTLVKSSKQIEVLITLGGSDIRNLTIPILKSISVLYPHILFNAVIGTNIEDEIFPIPKNVRLYKNLDEQNMARVMQKCHLAISGGGQTLYELAVLRVDIIAIELIDNQREELRIWDEHGLLLLNLKWDDVALIDKLLKKFALYKHKKKKKEIFSSFNLQGIENIYKHILEK